jgi:hypothetical protein
MKKALLLLGIVLLTTVSFVFLIDSGKQDVKTSLQVAPISAMTSDGYSKSSQTMDISHGEYETATHGGSDKDEVIRNLKSATYSADISTGTISVTITRHKLDRFITDNDHKVDGYTVGTGFIGLYVNNVLKSHSEPNFVDDDNSKQKDTVTISTVQSIYWNTSYSIKVVIAVRSMMWAVFYENNYYYKGTGTATLKFTDDEKPTGTLSGVTNGSSTNGNVSFSWTDPHTATAKLNGSSYTSGTTISTERTHSIVLTDQANLSNTYTFTIDKTKPIITLSNVSSGGFTKNNVTATFGTQTVGAVSSGKSYSGDTLTAKYSMTTGTTMPTSSGTAFSSGTVFSTAGHYRLQITDTAGNSTAYTFTIDKTAPTMTLSGVSSGGFTNDTVTVTFITAVNGITNGTGKCYSTDTITAKYSAATGTAIPTSSGTAFSSGETFSTAGHYRLEITDSAGNSTVYTFTIDKTAPAITLSGISSGGFTNGTVTATFITAVNGITNGTGRSKDDDTITAKYSTATSTTTPASSATVFASGQIFNTAGHYRLQITDAANNSTVYTFTIDKTAPVLSLSGVAADGFTNGTVTTAFTTVTNGITDGTGRSKDDDTITAKYSVATGTAMPTSSSTAFSSGQTFNTAGHYRLEIADSAGNSTVYNFTIDKTAPTITLSGVANNGFTNGTVTAAFVTAINGITDGTGRSYGTDTITAQYTMGVISMPASSITAFANGMIFVDVGHYRLQITDRANNSTVYTFTIDRIAPTITLSGVTDGGATNNNVTVSWGTNAGGVDSTALSRAEDTLTAYYTNNISTLPDTANTQFSRGTEFTAEGWYLIRICDSAGNERQYSFVIDKTKPQNNLNYTWYGDKAYTNRDIFFAPTANLLSIVSVYVKYDNGVWAENQITAAAAGYNVSFNGMTITVSNGNNNGAWYFKAKDTAGNVSEEQCVVMDLQTTFGNKNIIYNSYKTNYWWNLGLPSNIFGVAGKDIAGTYHAASYELALNFAIAKEWEYRVSVVPTGYMYVSSGNGNLAQLYTNRAELDAIVEKYAKTYIKERSIAKNGINNFANIINNNLTVDETALTRQYLITPSFLQYELPTYFMDDNYKFADPKFRSASFVKIQMVANDIAVVDRSAVQLSYDTAVSSQIFGSGNNGQGYYLVTEWDNAGNFEQYYVYIDLSAPTLSAVATYGNNTIETVTFNETLIENYGGSLRYTHLDLRTIADSIDNYVVITVNGRKINSVSYVQGDELPVLDGVDYYGNYTIDIYDRSGNTLNFVVAISGTAPYMSNSSLSSETNCKLTLNIPDTINAIVQIKLYHILYDGIYEEMTTDHNGTPVTTDILQYVIAIGGKYTIWYTDLFGRMLECTPVFYLKGLPAATLSGVTDGGTTNKNVSLKYNAGNTLVLYKLTGEQKEIIPVDEMLFSCVFDEIHQKYTATLTANEITTASYLFFLYSNDDMGLFVEYTFAIDCIIAPIYIYNQDGTPAVKDTYTNQPFYFLWNESVTLRYYTSATPGGELFAVKYTMNTLLTANAIYYFTLKDAVGNEEQFTILLDTIVSYKIEGDYVKTSLHGYLAKNDLKFTITEAAAVAVFDSTPNVINGGMITAESNYAIAITDAYGNSVSIMITIDKTPPIVSLAGVTSGGITSGAVTVNVTDYLNIYRVSSTNQILSAVASGEVFTDEGQYRITATDLVGNSITVVFTIDKSVAFTSNIANAAITTKTVTFNFNETLYSQNATLDGGATNVLTRYTNPGKYVITATDLLANELYFEFTILPARVRAVDINDLENYAVISITRDNLACSYAIENGNLYIAESGNYTIALRNNTNNTEFNFVIEVDSIVQMTADIVHRGITTNTISVSFAETVTQTVIRSGSTISSASRYSTAGFYQITAADSLGNELYFEFTILPARVRQIALENLNGIELTTATKDGEPYAVEITDNQLHIADGGDYSFAFRILDTDEIFSFDITVDDSVNVAGNIPNGAFTTNAVIISFSETVTQTVTRNSETVKTAATYSTSGKYIIHATDDLGNELFFEFTILPARVRQVALDNLGGMELTVATRNDETYTAEITDGRLLITDGGQYSLSFVILATTETFAFEITVDDFVNITCNISNRAVTTNAVTISFAETVTQSVTRNSETVKNATGYSISGKYIIHATDDLGNELFFEFIILPARVRQIALDNLNGIELTAATKDGNPYTAEITAGQLLITDGGNYSLSFRITATGETFSFDITVDAEFSFWATVPNGGITTEPVEIVFAEEVITQTITLNGEKIKTTTNFSAVGRYVATYTDSLGNGIEFIFEILPQRVKEINWLGLNNFAIVSALLNDEPFTVAIENGNLYIAERGQYTLAIKDGSTEQEWTFAITVDNFVNFTGSIPNGAFTTNAVTISFAETITQKEVYYNSEKIKFADSYSATGCYRVLLTDDLGNQTEFVFEILPIRVRTLDIKEFNKFAILSLHKDGSPYTAEITAGQLLITDGGQYLFVFKNTATEQQWTFTITVDNFVNFTSNIPNGAITTNAVSLVFLETITKKEVYKDGEKLKFIDSYSATGRYSVLLTDDLDNQTEFVFEILPMKVNKIDIDGLTDFNVVNALKDGSTVNVSMDNGHLLIANKGYYMLAMTKNSTVFSFNIEIDNTPPTADIKISNGEFVVKNVSVENVTAKLTKDGKAVSNYNVDKTMEGAGKYVLILTDALGNTNTYEFTVTDPPNWATYATIGGFAGIGAIVLVFVYIAKRRLKVR